MLRTRAQLNAFKNELMQRRTKAELHLEKALRNTFKGKGSRIKPNAILGFYIVDFLFKTRKLIIEVDGLVHDTDFQKAKDKKRDLFFQSCGFNVLRFTNDEVLNDVDMCVKRVKDFKKMPSFECASSIHKTHWRRTVALNA